MLILINRFYKFSLLIASLFLTQFTFAQEEVIEEIVVTGSFIKTASKSDTSPVDIILRDEIDGMGAFLASDMANYINGETIHVNGGMYMA